MTNEMINVYDDVKQQMEKECIFCLENLKKANQAGNVSLPHVNEQGVNVLHGARLEMQTISEYWYQRLALARRFVSREFEDQHELWNRKIGL